MGDVVVNLKSIVWICPCICGLCKCLGLALWILYYTTSLVKGTRLQHLVFKHSPKFLLFFHSYYLKILTFQQNYLFQRQLLFMNTLFLKCFTIYSAVFFLLQMIGKAAEWRDAVLCKTAEAVNASVWRPRWHLPVLLWLRSDWPMGNDGVHGKGSGQTHDTTDWWHW